MLRDALGRASMPRGAMLDRPPSPEALRRGLSYTGRSVCQPRVDPRKVLALGRERCGGQHWSATHGRCSARARQPLSRPVPASDRLHAPAGERGRGSWG